MQEQEDIRNKIFEIGDMAFADIEGKRILYRVQQTNNPETGLSEIKFKSVVPQQGVNFTIKLLKPAYKNGK